MKINFLNFDNLVLNEQGKFATPWMRWLSALRESLNNLSNGITSGTYDQAPENPDINELFYVAAPFYHLVIWDGTQWQFADDGNGFVADFVIAKTNGWHICDGTLVTYLTVGVTLGTANFTTPNLTTGAYKKGGAAYAGIVNPAVAPIFTGTPGLTNNDNAYTAATGGALDVSLHTHQHSFVPAGTNTAGEPKNIVTLSYFRR